MVSNRAASDRVQQCVLLKVKESIENTSQVDFRHMEVTHGCGTHNTVSMFVWDLMKVM